MALDVIDHFNTSKKSALLFTIDFKKAFDSLNWNFMFESLRKFNFGDSFIRWIKTLYSSPKTCIKNNGYLSEPFDLRRGIRQGCQISALIFIIAIEILGIRVRNSRSITGLNFGNNAKSVKIAQYADDCMLFLNNKDELCSAIGILRKFGYISGLILNLKKCECLTIGTYNRNELSSFGIKWPTSIKYLGINMGNDKKSNCIKNWDGKLDEIEKLLQTWEKRELTLFGKVLVVKCLAVSKVVLCASTLPVPKQFIDQLNKIISNFLWGMPFKVSRKKCN